MWVNYFSENLNNKKFIIKKIYTQLNISELICVYLKPIYCIDRCDYVIKQI